MVCTSVYTHGPSIFSIKMGHRNGRCCSGVCRVDEDGRQRIHTLGYLYSEIGRGSEALDNMVK